MSHVPLLGETKHGASTDLACQSHWLQLVRFWYPDLNTRTYCVPPLHFNKVPFETSTLAGQSVRIAGEPGKMKPVHSVRRRPYEPKHLDPEERPPHIMWRLDCDDDVPVAVSGNDARADFAQQHVLRCLQVLGDELQEPMFILSQLEFGDYLKKSAASALPRPADLGRQKYDRGDFDVLVIHRKHGFLIGEIKAVGFNDDEMGKSKEQRLSDVAKRVQRGVKQLERAEYVLNHLLSDMLPQPRVRKALILPYVDSQTLHEAMDTEDELMQSFCRVIEADNMETAVLLTLCSDQLSKRDNPHFIDSETLSRLKEWWMKRMGEFVDPYLTDDVYTDLVARFAGPATTVSVYCPNRSRVEVRAQWEAVSELGERLLRVTLTPEQFNLVNKVERMVCVSGPPGTGKTLILALVGLRWLREGHVVTVVSTTGGSLAASKLIYEHLQVTYGQNLQPDQLRFLKYDMHVNEEDVEKATNKLLGMSEDCGALHILMDEAKFAYGKVVSGRLHDFVKTLHKYCKNICLWAATLERTHVPDVLRVESLAVPLRSVPTVVREVQKGLARYPEHIARYDKGNTPPVSDGPPVIRLRHQGDRHTGQWPVQCRHCGLMVAEIVHKQLHVGFTVAASPPSLQYRDVFVLTRSSELRNDVIVDGHVIQPAGGFVAGLRAARIPVRVVCYHDDHDTWEKGVGATACARDDVVTVANHTAVSGLERKVVIFLPGMRESRDSRRNSDQQEARDRVVALSRCISQLVMIDMPDYYEHSGGQPLGKNPVI